MVDRIEVVWGVGDARTGLGAFDTALADANIHNYNLVYFSSVIPENTDVVELGRAERAYPVGEPVGVVLAKNESSRSSERIAAGLGWVHAEQGGLFMESTAGSAPACRDDLEKKLADARDLRDWDWMTEETVVVRETTVDDNAAVLVGAIYGPMQFTDEVSSERV